MKKFIVTRLGCATGAKAGGGVHLENDPDYVFKTIKNMLDFTYYGVKNQTISKKDLTWVFYTGPRFQDHYRDMIREVCEDITVDFIRGIEFKNKIKPWQHHDEYMMIRLDADDYMHPELLDLVEKQTMKHYNGKNIVICGPQLGYKLYPNGELKECKYPKIALGLAITSSCGAMVFHDHTKLKEIYEKHGPTIETPLETNRRLYLYNRTPLSHSFIIEKNWQNKSGYLPQSAKILKEFGADQTPYIKRLQNEKN